MFKLPGILHHLPLQWPPVQLTLCVSCSRCCGSSHNSRHMAVQAVGGEGALCSDTLQHLDKVYTTLDCGQCASCFMQLLSVCLTKYWVVVCFVQCCSTADVLINTCADGADDDCTRVPICSLCLPNGLITKPQSSGLLTDRRVLQSQTGGQPHRLSGHLSDMVT